jgi:hypothetical protein
LQGVEVRDPVDTEHDGFASGERSALLDSSQRGDRGGYHEIQ